MTTNTEEATREAITLAVNDALMEWHGDASGTQHVTEYVVAALRAVAESPTDEDTVTDAEVEAAWAGFLSASHDPHQLASENVRRYVRVALEAARTVRVVSVPPTPTPEVVSGIPQSLHDKLERDGVNLRGYWSNGDPVHVITDGTHRRVAPNLNGATWIPLP